MKKILLIFLGIFIVSCNDQVEKKHNILFISIDDLRPTMNSYNYVNETMITPYMDKLASKGVQFNNAFTNIAVCGASRASIMTGIRPSAKRFNDFSTRFVKFTWVILRAIFPFSPLEYSRMSFTKFNKELPHINISCTRSFCDEFKFPK